MSLSPAELALRGALAACLSALSSAVWAGACVRHADLYDAPDGALIEPPPSFDAGPIEVLDAALRGDAFAACEMRPYAPCSGPVDFPCDFENFVLYAAEVCQEATGCVTNGALEVKLATDGCVAEMGMDEPNDAIVACLVEKLTSARCPCGASTTNYSFGHGNEGCDGG